MLKDEIKAFFKGDVDDSEETLTKYSHDASLFEVRPKLVIFPKDSADFQALVSYINKKRAEGEELSLAVRAAGSCMSGGSLTESIVADVTKYMNEVGEIKEDGTTVMPGVFYRDFEKKTLEKNLILPCYTASKNMNAIGGMIGNNSAGEKTLRYGQMEKYVRETKVLFADGKEYTVRPLTKNELEVKMNQGDFEGNLYKDLFYLIQANKKTIEDARPSVTKNSAGYALWNVWDGETFDMNKVLVGSQGTLGIVTEAKLSLVPVEKASKLFVIFLKDLTHLAELVNVILPTNPDSVESYDDATMKLAFRFFPEMLRTMKAKHFLSLMLSFIPEALMMLRGGMPKLIMLVEYAGNTNEEIDKKMDALEKAILPFKVISRKTISEEESNKYWTVRRESFSLLRKHIHGSRTAPFVDDVVVLPKHMPEFLPKMREILDRYELNYTIAGHAGNGNFHIIPLMDMHKRGNIDIIKKVSEEVYDLVEKYKGSITAEHNDGIIRTPYLHKMFSNDMLELFRRTKEIFDPKNVFNPGKKVPVKGGAGTIEYMCEHIAVE